MKFVVSSSELLKSVLIAQKAIPMKTSEAILNNYLFVLKGNKLEITASDKEITLKTELEAISVEEEGSLAIPAKQITDLLRELPHQPLPIKVESENSFTCAWTNGESILPYYNAEDYPVIKTVGEGANVASLSSLTLADGISSTVYASSDDANRPTMNSIYFDFKPAGTTFVASDLQKLICFKTNEVKAATDCSFILNKRHAGVIRSILGKEDEETTITFDNKIAMFKFGQTTAICCLVSGKYPDYNAIIPKESVNTNVLNINRVQFLNTVRRISVCSPKASGHVKFSLTQGCLEVSAQDLGFEIAAHETIDCQYEGDDLTIGFKSTHIVEILSNLGSENVLMRFADKRRTAIIIPADDENTSEKVSCIVMPIMVR